MRPDCLIEKTAAALSARLEEIDEGREDNSRETVQRALGYLLDRLEEDILQEWDLIFLRGGMFHLGRRLDQALGWARANSPDVGP